MEDAVIFPPVPSDTAREARAVFGQGNFYLVTGDRANYLFMGLDLDDRVGRAQKPPRTLAILMLITIFQFIEILPDELAVDALRKRVDWKYALHLPLKYPGLKASALCEYRQGLLANPDGEWVLQTVVSRLSEIFTAAGRLDLGLGTGRVVTEVCTICRLDTLWEAISQVLETLATRQPDWLLSISLPHWYTRYGRRPLSLVHSGEGLNSEAEALSIGTDGVHLLRAISYGPDPGLADLPEVSALEQTWRDQFELSGGQLAWRRAACAGCAFSARQREQDERFTATKKEGNTKQ